MEQSDNATIRVLALHDDETLRRGIIRSLEEFTFEPCGQGPAAHIEVLPVSSVEDATACVARNAPDILILDAALPDGEGLDVLRTVHSHCPSLLALMLMGNASIQTAVDATRQGAFGFLPKPFTPAELRHTLRRAGAQVMLTRRTARLEAEKRQVRFDFIRVLGHELKAPLSAVETNMGIFNAHLLGDSLSAYDELLQRSTLRLGQMRKLIVDLLDMTRLESGQKTRQFEELDLRLLAADALELADLQARERGIALHLDSPESVPFRGDRGELDMIFNNLVSNAVKYNRDDGEVFVTLAPGSTGVTITVRDTGIGMTPDEVGKLFGEFVRIRNAKTARILGSGLGLSILKRLAELYDGRVDVSSQPDVGSTFRVFLESTAAEASAPQEGEP